MIGEIIFAHLRTKYGRTYGRVIEMVEHHDGKSRPALTIILIANLLDIRVIQS